MCTGIQRGTPPRASQLIDWAQQGETGTVQIGVARNPPLEHAFGLLLKDLAHNNWGSRVERRSTLTGNSRVAVAHVLRSRGRAKTAAVRDVAIRPTAPARLQSTSRYTHLDDGHVLDAAARIGQLIADAVGEVRSLNYNTKCDRGSLVHDR